MKRTLTTLAMAALTVAAATAFSCNGDALSGTDPNGNGNGDGGDGGMSTGDGGGGFNTDAACGMVSATATLAKAPVDIIMVVDNSGSMTQEITAVQSNINVSFASILKASNLDYRVILISHHGTASADQSICIDAPLAGNASCVPPPTKPTFSPNFFQYSQEIASHNSLDLIISTYAKADAASVGLAPNGWQAWLRPGAVKTFIEVTDDNQANTYTSATFDTALLGLSAAQFGTAAKRNYVFHSIIGLKENTVVTQAYLPTDPIVTTQCSTAANGGMAGSVYQNLSILTGGLRYPVCQTANYDAVFKAVAQGVVTGTTINCDFPVPAAPPGKTYVLTTAQLKYTPGDGSAPQYFKQVSDLGQCAASSFYIQGTEIYMCPSTCTTVQADTKAAIALALDCNSIIG